MTGTDTGVGKTLIAAALLKGLRNRGLRVAGMKPVASGGRETPEGWVNDDALALIAEASEPAPYRIVNPYSFNPAVAPHIAAVEAGVEIDLREIVRAFRILSGLAEIVVVEGAGGWLTPLNDRDSFPDLARMINAQVVLVVGMRLGCLNHALLSAQAIEASGQHLVGWVANSIDPAFQRASDNLRSLEQRLKAPLLGSVPYQAPPSAAFASECLDLDRLRLQGSSAVTR
ncbi:MAG TPA: dethiobiotin synthase [Steroidobacteraceae bacterium]